MLNGTKDKSPTVPVSPEKILVIIEPQAGLLRYVSVAHQRFSTLVLTASPKKCLTREQRFNASLGRPENSEIDHLVECDVFNVDAMYAVVSRWEGKICGVVAGDDSMVPNAAALGLKLGFDYATPEDAITQRIKSNMKTRLRAFGVPTPTFFIAKTEEEAMTAWTSLGNDCMIKMVDMQGSVNIFRVTDISGLRAAWDAIIHNSTNLKLHEDRIREVILEEYVTGRELTVEGYIQGNRIVCLNFCEKITDNFVVVGHLLPAIVSTEEAKVLEDTAAHCVKALGIRNSVFHIEIHLNGLRPQVIECASRLPGVHSVELMYQTYGFDLAEISVSLAVGDRVSIGPTAPSRYFAMLALYSKQGGTLNRIEGLEELKARDCVMRTYVTVSTGDLIKPGSSIHQDGFIILEDKDPIALLDNVHWARNNIRYIMSDDMDATLSMGSATL